LRCSWGSLSQTQFAFCSPAPPLEFNGNAAAHDAWFRIKVQQVIDDKWPDIAHEDVETHFTARREGSLRKPAKGSL
jgi:DNA-damage-inducible protein J